MTAARTAIFAAILSILSSGMCIATVSADHVTSLALSGSAIDLSVSGDYAYVATSLGLDIVNVSNPTAPVHAGFCSLVGAIDVCVQGDYAYVAVSNGTTTNNLTIVDVSDRAHPVTLGTYQPSGVNVRVHRVCADGNYVYVQYRTKSAAIATYYDYYCAAVDVSNPGLPVEIAKSTTTKTTSRIGYGAAAAAGKVFTVDSALARTSFADPAAPTSSYLSSVSLGGCDVCADDAYAYAAFYTGTSTNPTAYASKLQIRSHTGTLIGALSMSTPCAPQSLFVAGKYAYVALGSAGINIIDIDDPTVPQSLAMCDTPGFASGVCVDGEYAFVADTTSGLSVCHLNGVAATVTLLVSPDARQGAGQPVSLLAYGYTGKAAQYQFREGSNVIRDFGSDANFIWTPTDIGACTLTVVAKDSYGSTSVSPEVPYTIVGPLRNVTLTTDLASPQMAKTAITLTANPDGGVYRQYYFYVNDVLLESDDYYRNTLVFQPQTAGVYQLKVRVLASMVYNWATWDDVTSPAVSYTILGDQVDSVSLAATQASPQPVGTTIALTASAVGGTGLQYKFMAGSTILRDFAAGNSFSWTPAVAGTYELTAIAKDSTGKTVTSAALSYVVQSVVDSVDLAATQASPQPVGTTIALTASAVGGTGLQYKFVAGSTILRDFAAGNSFSWTPAVAGTYELTAIAKDSTGKTVTSGALSYVVQSVVDSVSLAATQASPQPEGTTITLTASAVGGTGLQYKFVAGSTILRDFAAGNSFSWTPAVAGTYELTAIAKDSTGKTVTSGALSYVVQSVVDSVSLAADPGSPQPVGTLVTLTATAVGGTDVQYKFMAGSIVLRDFASSNVATWTFSTANDHQLIVIAKDSTGKTVTSPVLVYTVLPGLQSVSLSTNPTSPVPVGTAVTLTATSVGGADVQYRFMAGSNVLRDFAPSNSTTYEFSSANTHQLTVTAKDSTGRTVTSPALAFTVLPGLQSVSLEASPDAPVTVGTAVSLTATCVGGADVEYKFMAGPNVLRDFAPSNSTIYRFSSANNHQLTVIARDATGATVTSPVLVYTVMPGLQSVRVSASPNSPVSVGTTVTLTAISVGGTGVQYKFMAGPYVLRDFAPGNSTTYRFSSANNHQLTVIARDATGRTITSPVLSYTVLPALQSVNLSVSPNTLATVGTPVTLAAASVGGAGVQYKFMAGTVVLRDFAPSNTTTYQFRTANNHQLKVIARDSAGRMVTSPTTSYTVYAQ